jgi:prepilin signal peptidase PulO-like enzyme (type II secretory pathway)
MFSRTDILEKTYLFTTEIISTIFRVALVSYLFFYLVESLKTGFVSDYISLNLMLVITLVSGALAALSKDGKDDQEEREKTEMPDLKQYIYIIFLGILVSVVVYERIKQVGWLSYVVSGVSSVIMVVISILFWRRDNNSEINN